MSDNIIDCHKCGRFHPLFNVCPSAEQMSILDESIEKMDMGEHDEGIKHEYPRMFAVTDGVQFGLCYSWYDHFDVVWDDGSCHHMKELSIFGIRKVTQGVTLK